MRNSTLGRKSILPLSKFRDKFISLTLSKSMIPYRISKTILDPLSMVLRATPVSATDSTSWLTTMMKTRSKLNSSLMITLCSWEPFSQPCHLSKSLLTTLLSSLLIPLLTSSIVMMDFHTCKTGLQTLFSNTGKEQMLTFLCWLFQTRSQHILLILSRLSFSRHYHSSCCSCTCCPSTVSHQESCLRKRPVLKNQWEWWDSVTCHIGWVGSHTTPSPAHSFLYSVGPSFASMSLNTLARYTSWATSGSTECLSSDSLFSSKHSSPDLCMLVSLVLSSISGLALLHP